MSLLSLPDEIIIHILKYADNRLPVLLTCRQISHLALKHIYTPWFNSGKKISHAVKMGWTDLFIVWTDEAGTRWNPALDDSKALRLACEHGRKSMLILMLRYQLDPNSIGLTLSKLSPIEKAILNNQSDIVEMLLKYTKEKEYPVAWGFPPFKFIPVNHISDDCADILQMLLDDKRFTPVVEDGYNALCWASASGKANLTQVLLADPRIDPTFGESLALYEAAKGNQVECVEILLADGRSDPSTRDNYIIKWASRKGYFGIVQKLLGDSRVDPTDGNNHAYKMAQEKKRYAVVELLRRDIRVILRGRA